ncbi:hypothetical protein Vadar_007118 [Vaccinium darrowii]|nr:hypothetical protein Vadar_007118 [Vaccinium darrowii]
MADIGIIDLEEGFGDSGVNSSRCLVGKVAHGKIIKTPVLANILNAAWRTRAPFHIDDWSNNIFLFRFENEEDRISILQEGPWSVMSNLLVLLPLSDGMVISELDFNVCPFWVQIHGLPVEKMSRANAVIIGSRMGKLLAVESASDGLCLERGFLRVKVEMDVSQPLPKGFWLRGRTDSSRDRWITFKYEKLPDYCYACGRLGHDNRGCRFVTKEEGERSGYGPKLKTGRARRAAIPIEVIRAEVDAAEVRVQNLIRRRPVIQVHDRGARVVNEQSDHVIRTRNHEVNEVVGGHYSPLRTDDHVLQEPGGEQSRETGVTYTPLLSMEQGTNSSAILDSLSVNEPGMLPNSSIFPIETSPDPAQIPCVEGSKLESGPQYYVIEPPDSPKPSHSTQPNCPNKPKPLLLNHPLAQINPDSSHTLLLDGCLNLSPPNITSSNLSLSPTTNDYPNLSMGHNSSSSPSKSQQIPSLNPPVLTLNTTPILPTKSPSPKSTDIALSTVFNSLSLKRKAEDEATPDIRSKILRICSPPQSCDPLPPKPNRPSCKPKRCSPRAKATPNKGVSSMVQNFNEDGLCEIPIGNGSDIAGEFSSLQSVGVEFMITDVDGLGCMVLGDNGRVAGPEQPQSSC